MAIVIPYVQCTTLGSMYQCVLSLCLRTFTLAMLEVMLLTSNGSNPKAVITARMGARKLLVRNPSKILSKETSRAEIHRKGSLLQG